MSKLVSSVLKGLWVFLCNSSVLYIVTNNIMWIHCISGSKCHYIIYLTVPHACLGRDPWRDSMYSSEGTSVLVRNAWLIWLFTVKCFAFKWPWPWWGSLLVVWMCTVGGSGTKLQQRTNQKSLQIIKNLTRTVDLEPRKTGEFYLCMCPTGLLSPHFKPHFELKIALLQTFVLQPVGLSYVFKVYACFWMSTPSCTDQFSDVYKSTLMSTHMEMVYIVLAHLKHYTSPRAQFLNSELLV